jgi:ribose-phosphate pyrophosphokinase
MGKTIDRDDAKRLMVFAGRASEGLGRRIAERLEIEVGDVTLKTFANGELYTRFEESVRGADVFLVQSTASAVTSSGEHMSVNDSLMELIFMIDAARLASAHRITAVIPWYGYSRQDKKSAPCEPISAKAVADMLHAVGVHRVLTMDLHAGQIQGFFHIPVDHMTAVPLLAEHFESRRFGGDLGGDEIVVVSPDAGRVKLANHFKSRLDGTLAVLAKQRPAHNVAEVLALIGDVEGKVAILIDDMIDTAGTLVKGAEKVKEAGATRVFAAATHGIFSGPAYERLADSVIERVIVTDTIPLPPGAPDKIDVVSVGRILGDTIRNVFWDDSVSEIFEGENQLF